MSVIKWVDRMRRMSKRDKKQLTTLTRSSVKTKISYADYCSQICKAKCCHVWQERKSLCSCPKLDKENLCSIYKERFLTEPPLPFSFNKVVSRADKLHVISAHCGRIEEIIANGDLPKWIEDQCCFAHPELLERDE